MALHLRRPRRRRSRITHGTLAPDLAAVMGPDGEDGDLQRDLAGAALTGATTLLRRAPARTDKQVKADVKATNREQRLARVAAVKARKAQATGAIPYRGVRGPGGGAATVIDVPPEYRATTVQACGLWPWSVGSGTPMIGTPVGHHLHTGATVCFDPISWFLRAQLISNPSMFMLGLPGLGKSTFIRKLVTGAAATGVVPMILGDLKPDYAELVRQLGGQVVQVGRGRGYLNPLSVGALGSILPLLRDRPATYSRIAEEVHGRRLSITSGLVSLVRQSPISDTEQTILSTALRMLDEAAEEEREATGVAPEPPLLTDLVDLIGDGAERLREVTLTETEAEYRAETRRLHLSLIALMSGPVGEVFSQQTTVPLDLDATAVCIDLSGISATDEKLTAAVLLACWNDGFGAIEAAHTLADEGLAPQRYFFAVLDELWRVLRAGVGMVDRVDELTRINRTLGLGQAMISHSMDDLEALASEADRAKARGFVERAGAVVCGGLPTREIEALTKIVGFTDVEQEMITSWSSPSTLSTTGEAMPPPGQGNFLIKIGSRTGIPVHVDLVEAERRSEVHNTNKRWQPNTTGVLDGPSAVLDPETMAAATEQAAAAGITAAVPHEPLPPIPENDGQGRDDDLADDLADLGPDDPGPADPNATVVIPAWPTEWAGAGVGSGSRS